MGGAGTARQCFWHSGTRVWLVGLDGVDSDQDAAILGPAERERASRYVGVQDASRFIAAHAALRRLVSRHLGIDVYELEIGRRPCPGCGHAGHGPPQVTRPVTTCAISLSRSGPHALVALSDRGYVGVDVEAVDPDFPVVLVGRRFLSEAERGYVLDGEVGSRGGRFARCWCRKEAVAKAAGTGVVGDLTALDVSPHDPGPVQVAFRAGNGPALWSAYDLALPAGLVGAVAVPAR